MKKILMTSACMLSATYAAFTAVDMSSLSTARGFSIIGKNANDKLGPSVTSAGDFNKDNKDDLLITNSKGKAYIVFGKGLAQANAVFDLADNTKTTTDFITLSTNLNNAVLVGAYAGDVNGDSIDDVVIGAPDGPGQVFVVYGKTSPTDLDMATPNAPTSDGFKLDGPSDTIGFAVAAAGDFNGDGLDDIIISSDIGPSSAGMVSIVFGKKNSARTAFPPYGSLGNGGDGFRIMGLPNNIFGSSLAGIGDVNGDGKDDILVGAPGDNKAYIIYGYTPSPLADVAFNTLAVTQYAIITGAASSKFGQSVALAGDFNHDGKDDIMIAAPELSTSGSNLEGRVYVIFGQPAKADLDDIPIATLGAKGLTITGAANNDKLGYSIAGINDINDDGVDDIAVTAEGTPKAYVLFGKKNIADSIVLSANLATTSGVIISGPASSEFGKCVRAVGDINADGVDDFAISSPGYDYTARTDAGAAYIIYGVGEPVTGFISINTNTESKSSFRIGASISMFVGFLISLML